MLDSSYRKHCESLEQVRIDHELQAQKVSNINVAQVATFEPRPVSPKRGLLLLLAGVLAVSSAVGVALVAERLDGSFKSPEEVEGLLNLPVLLSVPAQDSRSRTPSGPVTTAAR
jgi:capsular polysaccharide biosynthesis protein